MLYSSMLYKVDPRYLSVDANGSTYRNILQELERRAWNRNMLTNQVAGGANRYLRW